jgi:hypothetical protein
MRSIGRRENFSRIASYISRDIYGPVGMKGKKENTYGFFGLFNASLDLLERGLDILIDSIYLILPDYGDGRLRSEFLRARPPHTPVPSHMNFGTRW